MSPLVQLYCKKLTIKNVGSFIAARPDHIGWQINLDKLAGQALDSAVSESAKLVGQLKNEGIRSVFLLHPSIDEARLGDILDRIQPDIFLASAARNRLALEEVARSSSCELMIPIGIPAPGVDKSKYDPVGEAIDLIDIADWFTTDTINEGDAVDRFGCSGKVSQWEKLAAIVRASSKPVIAAGGLTPENVGNLWELCHPAGFDAHSAVCTDGQPDIEKSKAFVNAVRHLNP